MSWQRLMPMSWCRGTQRAISSALIAAGTIFTMGENARQGVAEALSGANKITGQERLDKRYPGLALPFMGYLEFYGGGRVAELKTKTSSPSESAKTGRRAGALPSKPDAKHAQQVAFYADVLG